MPPPFGHFWFVSADGAVLCDFVTFFPSSCHGDLLQVHWRHLLFDPMYLLNRIVLSRDWIHTPMRYMFVIRYIRVLTTGPHNFSHRQPRAVLHGRFSHVQSCLRQLPSWKLPSQHWCHNLLYLRNWLIRSQHRCNRTLNLHQLPSRNLCLSSWSGRLH